MIIIPAIDIKGGKCVRLLQGDPDKATVYSDDPVQMAASFEKLGAELIHVVDLDGAFSGEPVNFPIVKKIREKVSIPLEIGGGIRNIDTVKKYADSGIKRIIIGTLALENEFDEMLSCFRENIIVGIDARNGKVATKGWKENTMIDAVDFAKKMESKGIREIIFTDISTDGMLQGPNIPSLKNMMAAVPSVSIIASGGISNLEDVKNLKKTGAYGCIIGKAIYDGRIKIEDALAI